MPDDKDLFEQVDRETRAMRAIATVLADLEPMERRRVLAWARQFEPPVTRSTAPTTPGLPPEEFPLPGVPTMDLLESGGDGG